MGPGIGERRSCALEQAGCICTMVKIAWIPSQVDVAAQGEYCSMPGCQTGGWAEEEQSLVCSLHSQSHPSRCPFLVSTPAFLCLELWDGLPPPNGAFSAVFSILGVLPVSSVFAVLHWFSYLFLFWHLIVTAFLSLSSPLPCFPLQSQCPGGFMFGVVF